MIKTLSRLKYWQLAVLGLATSVLAVVAISALLRAAVAAWPQAGEASLVAYVLTAAAVAWISVGIFTEAAFYKGRKARAEFLRDEALDAISDLYVAYKITPGVEYNGRRDDEYPDEMDPDEMAEAYGLTEKEADRG